MRSRKWLRSYPGGPTAGFSIRVNPFPIARLGPNSEAILRVVVSAFDRDDREPEIGYSVTEPLRLCWRTGERRERRVPQHLIYFHVLTTKTLGSLRPTARPNHL